MVAVCKIDGIFLARAIKVCYIFIVAIIIAKINSKYTKSKIREDVAMPRKSKSILGILYNHCEIFMCYEVTQRGVNT